MILQDAFRRAGTFVTEQTEKFSHFVVENANKVKKSVLEEKEGIARVGFCNWMGKKIDNMTDSIPYRTLGNLTNRVIKAFPFALVFSSLPIPMAGVFIGYTIIQLASNTPPFGRDFHRHMNTGLALALGALSVQLAVSSLVTINPVGLAGAFFAANGAVFATVAANNA